MPSSKEVLQEARKRKKDEASPETLIQLIEACKDRASAVQLERVWSCALRLTYPGDFVRGWNIQEKSQAVRLRKDFGPHAAAIFLSEVITRWPECVVAISKMSSGEGKEKPAIGWVMYHRDTLMNFLAGPDESGGGQPWDF